MFGIYILSQWWAIKLVMQSSTAYLENSRNPDSEKAMAPHSSTLAWKIPWMEEPDGLQSMGSLRVWHDWVTSLSLFTFMHWRGKWQPLQCSCLENPRDGEPGGLLSMGSHSRTRLKWLSSSSRSDFYHFLIVKEHTTFDCYCVVFCTKPTCHHYTIILQLWRFL